MAVIAPRRFVTPAGDHYTIASAEPGDAAPLLRYIRVIAAEWPYLVSLPEEYPAGDEEEQRWIEAHHDHAAKLALVAKVGGAIAGCLAFEPGLYRRTSHRGSLGVSVARPWRRQGIGTALIETLIGWAVAHTAIEKVELSVFAGNVEAIRLYEKLGFVEEGRRQVAFKLASGCYDDEILMGRFVKPVIAPAKKDERRQP